MDSVWQLIVELVEAAQRNYANPNLQVAIADEEGNVYEIGGFGEAQIGKGRKPKKAITVVMGKKIKEAPKE